MNSNRKAWILDVGHGNATVVEDLDHVSIIDGGGRDTLVRFLSDRGINRINTVFVSHADADHFGGISLLLGSDQFQVGKVFINPDARDSNLWRDFVSVMIDAKQRGTEFSLEFTDVNPGSIVLGHTRLEVVAPSQELAYRTSSGATLDGRRLTANAMSAVVRVWAGDSPRLLLAGDIDQVGLDSLIGDNSNIKADVLVFPHHGALPSRSDPTTFTEALIRAVGAKLVVFSIGRGRYGTPRPEIVEAVFRNAKDAHIACTQLSTHCAANLPASSTERLADFSEGTARNACCAGTISVSLEDDISYTPKRSTHLKFITENAPTALCQQRVTANAI